MHLVTKSTLYVGILGGVLWLYYDPGLISHWVTIAFLLATWFWLVTQKPSTRQVTLLICLFVIGVILYSGVPFPYRWLLGHHIPPGGALAISALYVLSVGLLAALLVKICLRSDSEN